MQQLPGYLILDFDSTFCKVEALDELFSIALHHDPQRESTVAQIRQITEAGMAGELPFQEALAQRMALLKANQSDLEALITKLKASVSNSIIRNKDFFLENKGKILIVSSGFREYIVPVVAEYGIEPQDIYANSLRINTKGEIVGYDQDYPLAQNGGKATVVKQLNLVGEVWVVGDGFTDYEIKKAGLATKFYAFFEHVFRENVAKVAQKSVRSFDEILYANSLKGAISYPKSKIKVLLLENIHPDAQAKFEQEGFHVETVSSALSEDELCDRLKDISMIGIRSKTQLTAKVLHSATRLKAIGAFCIGTNQIDLDTCTELGIAVFNAPYSNTRSVVELAIGEMIILMRGIPDKSSEMHRGQWTKSAEGSHEIRGKKLGIIGYGNIGSQLSVLAEALGMKVLYYDITEKLVHGNAQKCHTIEELLTKADVVTLHVDGRPENELFFGHREFEMMKQGAIFLNLSRGFVVDIQALKQHIISGKLAGVSVDVFPEEPNNQERFESPLQGLPNTILTPHIGGSTLEAQENIADYVPARLMSYINSGDSTGSVNFPVVQLSEIQNGHRLLHVHHNQPGILAKINAIFAQHHTNVLGQYLKTNEQIGYLIIDVDRAYGDETTRALREIDGTIQFRILY